MRKRAYCNDCKKMRKIFVTLLAEKYYSPASNEAYYNDLGDGEVRCDACYSGDLRLSQDEIAVLLEAAYGATA